MKTPNFIFTLLLFACSTAFFAGCSREDESFSPSTEGPGLTFTSGEGLTSRDKTIKAGASFTTKILAASSPQGQTLTRFKISALFDNAAPVTILDSAINTQTLGYTFRHASRTVNGKETWIFEVTDSRGMVTKRLLNLNTLIAYADIATEFIAGNSLISADANLGLGVPFQAKLMAYSNMSGQNLKNVKVLVSYDNQPFVQYPGADIAIDAENYVFTFNGTTRSVPGTEQFKFVVSDSSREAINFLNINVSNPVTTVNTFSYVSIGAQMSVNTGAFLDATTGTVFYQSPAIQNSQGIDVMYFYHNTWGACLFAPGDTLFGNNPGQISSYNMQNWPIRNVTSFKVLGTGATSDFANAVTPGAVADLYTNSGIQASTRATNLLPNSVIAFKTADHYFGLIKVNSISGAGPNNNPAAGSIAVSLKIQAP